MVVAATRTGAWLVARARALATAVSKATPLCAAANRAAFTSAAWPARSAWS
jgi:hypothetical protein